MREKRIKHPDWKTSASERRWYFFSQTARYAAQALLPAHMAMFLLFNGIDTAIVAVSFFTFLKILSFFFLLNISIQAKKSSKKQFIKISGR